MSKLRRSRYGFIDGFVRYIRDALPTASYIGFTGTPIEKMDENTRAVLGDGISIYDIQRTVALLALMGHMEQAADGILGIYASFHLDDSDGADRTHSCLIPACSGRCAQKDARTIREFP